MPKDTPKPKVPKEELCDVRGVKVAPVVYARLTKEAKRVYPRYSVVEATARYVADMIGAEFD